MKYNNLIIFATYWNESDWIDASLKQIDALNPKEIVICDWCFDPKIPNHSTDWTREKIEKWISKRDNAKLISAIRVPNKLVWFLRLFKWYKFNNLIRLYSAFLAMIENIYRINQAITFNYMREISDKWKNWDWFMNFDADQFYSDETIKNIIKICNSKNNYWLMTAKEKTFFLNFLEYTQDYEKRTFNNMPHKIYSNTFVKPTRDNHREYFFSRKYYINDSNVKSIDVWTYNHYKFRIKDKKRVSKWYTLWDRKSPILSNYSFKKYDWVHPSIIKNLFWV